MEIEYVTHASLFFRAKSLSLLTDPFFYPELDPMLAPSVRNFPPRPIDKTAFGKIDYVFSSHEHHDHCHPETLLQLKEQIKTVLLPADRPELEARYRSLGFGDIRLLQNRKPVCLEDGVELTAYWDDLVDSLLLVRMDGKAVVHMNDCLPRLSTLAEIAGRCKVDYAFVCSTSAQNLYPLLLSRPAAELTFLARVREDNFFASQLRRIDALRPEVLIPYSYTATYIAPDQIALNGYARLTPPLFRDRLQLSRPEVKCWALQPGDRIDTSSNSVIPFREENLWGQNLQQFAANIALYTQLLRAGDHSPLRFQNGEPEDCEAKLLDHLQNRLRLGVPHQEIYRLTGYAVTLSIIGDSKTKSYLVDIKGKDVAPRQPENPDQPEPLLEIRVPASLMAIILSGAYDPFIALYTYRISFIPHVLLRNLNLKPGQEHALYLGALLMLFIDPENKLMNEFKRIESVLGILVSNRIGLSGI